MSRVGEGGLYPLADVDGLAILAGPDIVHGLHSVLHRVDGLHQGAARPLVLPVLILRVGLLDVGAVGEHDLQQIGGEAGGPDRAGKALLHQHGHPAAVVDVGVGDEHIVNGVGGEGQLPVVDLVPALLEAAVDQNSFSVDLQAVAAAGDALVRAEKAELHGSGLLFFH